MMWYMHIHSIWMLWNTSYDVTCVSQWCETYLGWVFSLNHYNTLWFTHQEISRFPSDFKQLDQHMQWQHGKDSYLAHPQHLKCVKHLICDSQWRESHCWWVFSLNHNNTLWFAPPRVKKQNVVTFKNLTNKGRGNVVQHFNYEHPQHIKVMKHLTCVSLWWEGHIFDGFIASTTTIHCGLPPQEWSRM